MSNLTGFESFCGGEFWDTNLTWNTDTPDFTPCFQKSILSWVPGFVLLVLTPFEVSRYLKSKNRHTPFNWLNVSKILLTLLLVAISLANIILETTGGDDISDIDYVTPTLLTVFYLVSLVLLLMSLQYGVHTSSAQFFFYLLSVACGAFILRSIVINQDNEDYVQSRLDRLLVTYSIQYAAICALFLLNLLADEKPKIYDPELEKLEKPCPRLTTSFFSRLMYLWSDKLLWTGYRNPLTPEMLWDPQPKLTTQGVVPTFDRHYERIVEKAEQHGKKHSVFPALLYTFGPMFFSGAAIKLVYDCLAMAAPLLMKLMIAYVESYAMDNSGDPSWKGYFYAVSLFIIQCVQSVILSQYFERMFVIGMNLRTAMTSMIYRKSLKMSGAAKKQSTMGETVNLMSVDIQRFMDLLPYLNMIWSAPLQIGLCCYFIYQELNEAMFAGLLVMLIAIPLNGIIASITRKFQLQQMKAKDHRVKLMNEILGGVKVLKLYGWEQSFIGQILGIRQKEIVVLKKTAWMVAMVNFIWISVPFLVALASFTTYVFIDGGNVLTPEKAFVTLAFLNIMRMPMAMLPFMIIGLVQASVSLDRINKYMNNEELSHNAVSHNEEVNEPIVVEKATFKWGKEEPVILNDIDMKVRSGSLTAVVGTVGSGKSSLISAILGGMEKVKGWVNVKGQIAYVPQVAWMQNTSLKNNVIFGKETEDAKYGAILDACALRSDIAILPGGDQTEIGEKGINLSGGQKQRVSLARAVYSDADLYLLDDPLSAVDSHVGKHIFDQVISHEGVLKNKTRVLVTHGITYLPKTDYIFVVKDGKISEQGTYQELLNHKGAFAEFLIEYMAEEGDDDDEAVEDIKHQLEETLGTDELQRELEKQAIRRRESVVSSDGDDEEQGLRKRSLSSESDSVGSGGPTDQVATQNVVMKHQTSVLSSTSTKAKKDEANNNDKGVKPVVIGQNLIEKEVAQTGSVKLAVYGYYMRNLGIIGVIAALTMQLFYQATSLGTNYWLNIWTNETLGNATDDHFRNIYLGVYGALGFGQALSTMILTITISLTTLVASKRMHKTMLEKVLRSPMAFFDTTPLGRIVNRFAKDVDVCDNTLPQNIRSWMTTFASFLGTIILIIAVIPFFVVVIVPTFVLFFIIQIIYVNTSRQLKRLESISRSPIYSHFGETLQGASTIRAFGRVRSFELESANKVDFNQVCYYPSIIANRWLAVRLEFIANFITFSAALFTIIEPDAIDPSLVGLVITYALSVTQTLNWLVRMTSDVETNIVAVERIKEYTKEIEQEADWEDGAVKPDEDWPQHGAVEFKGYGMRYREGLDLVVKDINIQIKGGETVGIVGRTGAGKSSLTVALFRLVEPAEGKIVIDGIDVSQLGLHDLRKKLTIIPQDPVLFSGTLRINLDPFGLHTDQEVWNALELAHLKDFVSVLEDGLEHEVSEGGDNVSVGQRQLICLARALLRKTKVLILDEATAAVDLETDDLIQATIRKEFAGCTVLTIAHRLNTIMDYDRIVVMDKGVVVEFDSPKTLLDNPNSIFYGMAKDANLV